MSNPYAPPPATPNPDDPKGLEIDPTLGRLRSRHRVCGVVTGSLLILVGLATVFGTFISPGHPPLAYGVVGIWILAVAIVACLGYECPAFIVVAIAVMWLAFLVTAELHVSSVDEPQRSQAVILRGILATPAVALFPIAVFGIATERAIRRRQAELDR
jgi:hypothetical protein